MLAKVYSSALQGFEFSTHGELAQGPDGSTVYTHPQVTLSLRADKPGTVFASSYCNIHGLWQNTQEIEMG